MLKPGLIGSARTFYLVFDHLEDGYHPFWRGNFAGTAQNYSWFWARSNPGPPKNTKLVSAVLAKCPLQNARNPFSRWSKATQKVGAEPMKPGLSILELSSSKKLKITPLCFAFFQPFSGQNFALLSKMARCKMLFPLGILVKRIWRVDIRKEDNFLPCFRLCRKKDWLVLHFSFCKCGRDPLWEISAFWWIRVRGRVGHFQKKSKLPNRFGGCALK